MQLIGRGFRAGSGYRYGFNGKEKDNDITAGDYDFGARIYDARSSRFLSVDKFTGKTAYYSPYIFAGNKPIAAIDYNGDVEIIITYHQTDRNGKIKVTTYKSVIETVEDLRGITRDAYKIDVYEKEVLMSQKVGNATMSWYGWQTSSIIQDKNSGKTPEERNFPGYGGYIAKNLYGLVVSTNPVATFGDAIAYNQDQVTREYKSDAQRYFQGAEAILNVVTLGRGALAGQGVKKILGEYLVNQLTDMGAEKVLSLGNDYLGFEKSQVLGYHIIRFAIDAKKGKIDDVFKLLQQASTVGQKVPDTIKELKSKFGVDLNPPKDGGQAVKQELINVGQDPKKLKTE